MRYCKVGIESVGGRGPSVRLVLPAKIPFALASFPPLAAALAALSTFAAFASFASFASFAAVAFALAAATPAACLTIAHSKDVCTTVLAAEISPRGLRAHDPIDDGLVGGGGRLGAKVDGVEVIVGKT